MGWEFDVRGGLDSLVGSFSGYRGGIGDDERNDEFSFVTQDHGVQDVGAGFERVFDGLRSDEFARRCLDQVFLAVGDEEIVVLVHVANVAGAEPAVFAKNFAGSFGILVIALHDARALDQDFAIIGGSDVHVGNRLARTAHAVLGIIAGDDRRSFGQTVTLIDGDADGPEKFGELFGKRRAAGRDDTQVSAGAPADFLVNQCVGELPLRFQGGTGAGSRGTPGSRPPGHIHGPIKNHSLYAGGFRALLDEAGIDFF